MSLPKKHLVSCFLIVFGTVKLWNIFHCTWTLDLIPWWKCGESPRQFPVHHHHHRRLHTLLEWAMPDLFLCMLPPEERATAMSFILTRNLSEVLPSYELLDADGFHTFYIICNDEWIKKTYTNWDLINFFRLFWIKKFLECPLQLQIRNKNKYKHNIHAIWHEFQEIT